MSQLCPNFLRNGACDVENCRHFHPTIFCESCGVLCPSQESFNAHIRTPQHASMKKAASRDPENGPKKCTICNVPLSSSSNVASHVTGHKHLVRLLQLREAGESIPQNSGIVEAEDRNFECHICGILVWQPRSVHENSLRHKRKEGFLAIRAALDEADRDKDGVSVEPSGKDALDFGLKEVGYGVREIKLNLEDPNSKIIIRSATISGAKQGSCFAVRIPTNVYLPSTSSLRGGVVFDSGGDRGRFQDRLELVFEDARTRKRFVIVKPLLCIVGNSEDYELLRPVAPYQPKIRKQREDVKELVLGERPPALAAIVWTTRLGQFEIRKPLKTVLEMPILRDKLRLVRSTFMPRVLEAETHARHFHLLLHLEEHQSEKDLGRYDEEEAPLKPVPREKLYYLEVPGLTEKRPSVLMGDRILVRQSGSTDFKWWEGYVHKVQLCDVGLRFNNGFRALMNEKFDVRFCLNRLPLRRMHGALDVGTADPRLLFPEDMHVKNQKPSLREVARLTPFNRLVGSNPPQMVAVTAIRNLPAGSPPFVVFGPPGTGKTVTIIEAIRQILGHDPTARILACAPSNSAADIIAGRLTVLGRSQLFRLMAPSRDRSDIPTKLVDFTRKNDQGTFCIPPVEELKKFRVVVSTCISAFVPYGIGVPPGHFSHIFIDEVGQASEPEALIPVRSLANANTNLILSGDPKQLGPIIRSGIARHFKLDVSFLDRVMAMEVYDEESQSGITIVKLIQNFRSHPDILKFPNERFYRGQLECHADPVLTHSLLNAPVLATRGFPIVFHAISGEDLREASSPSFFNKEEASLVKLYIQELKGDKRWRLTDENIGVISPYHAQCMKIRQLIKKLAKDVKVGSVEEFQGQERRVMIVSTVRSSPKDVEMDIKQTLGFVANPRRFNVAITRAQALLIIIGDPLILSLDPLWRSFLDYIYNKGGWKGRPNPDWDTTRGVDSDELLESRRAALASEEEELLQKLVGVIEQQSAAENIEDLPVGGEYDAEERPWREAD